MEIVVNRQYFLPNCTIGQITVLLEDKNNCPIYVCDSMEPHAIDWSKEKKVVGKTAIPCGEYDVEYRHSSKFRKLMPFLRDVPHFKGVMFHTGNRPCHSKGCILVGNNPRNKVGITLPQLINSCNCFKLLERFLKDAVARGEAIKVIIREDRRD